MDKHLFVVSARLTEAENQILDCIVDQLQKENPQAIIGKSRAIGSLIRAGYTDQRKQNKQDKRRSA